MTGNEFLVGKRVTVLGLGIEGVDVARYLSQHGAIVCASDGREASRLPHLRELQGLPIKITLGSNPIDDVADADMLFVSQGVPLGIPPVALARQRGIPISSMTRLFLERCPGITIGITGSSGKSTTTSLVGAILAAARRHTVVGGNIGVGLLSLLDSIRPDTWVVLEISHTQLEMTTRSPHIGAMLNVTPNHLDRYTWHDYLALKRNLLRFQTEDDLALLNLDDIESSAMAPQTRARVFWFSQSATIPTEGAFIRRGQIIWRRDGVEHEVLPIADIPLRGTHNVSNVLAATAITSLAGVDPATIAEAVRTFTPVPHRLEFVAQIGGADYYNDSIATTAERTLAALRSFEQPIVLLLGGREKHLPLEELAAESVQRCRAIVFFGESAETLRKAVDTAAETIPAPERPVTSRVATLAEAVDVAHACALSGDAVLLSPACTSFDAYDNFEQRGEEFRRLVTGIADSKRRPA